MPGVIESFVLIGLTSAGLSGAALGVGTAILTYGLIGGIGVGLQILASSLFKPQQPGPEDVQASVRQPAQPRVRHYGRVKTSGPWVFAESKSGNFYKLLALGQGPIDDIEEYWIDDAASNIDGSGNVLSGLFTISGSDRYLNIQTRLGAASETTYSTLDSAFPEWTTAHTGDGVASLLATQFAVGSEYIFKMFPNGINTNYRVVLRGAKILNPLTGTTAWSDSAAAVVLDYMKHQDGMRLPTSIFNTPLALAGWQEAATRCNQSITRKAGGTEPRYRLWGSYQLSERPADVLGRMMQSCDARLYPTSDGGITLDVGAWYEPTAILDEDAIVGLSDLSYGRDILTTANVIRATYLGVDQDYQSADADPWIDAVDVSARGEVEKDTSFIMAPSHGQARRLMKLDAYRSNPRWVGAFQCNLRGLAAIGERFVRIQYPLFSIDEVFEVQDFRLVIGEGNILQGVTLNVQSMPSGAYQWNAAQEEGDAPVRDDTTVDNTIPVPTGFGVTITRKSVGGSLVPYAALAWTAPPAPSLRVQAQGKRTADSQWIPIGVQSGATSTESFALSDGEQYEFQIRHVANSGLPSSWTTSINITPVADVTAPGPITTLVATGGVGQVAMTWVNPNSGNFYAVNVRRNTVNTEGTATLVHTEFGSASSSDAYTNTGLSAGTYYFWLKARNASGVESTSVASGAKTVT